MTCNRTPTLHLLRFQPAAQPASKPGSMVSSAMYTAPVTVHGTCCLGAAGLKPRRDMSRCFSSSSKAGWRRHRLPTQLLDKPLHHQLERDNMGGYQTDCLANAAGMQSIEARLLQHCRAGASSEVPGQQDATNRSLSLLWHRVLLSGLTMTVYTCPWWCTSTMNQSTSLMPTYME